MPAVIIPEIAFDFIGSDTDHLQKFRDWLASHNALIAQFNSLQALGEDVGSILTQIQGEIATFQNYLDNYDGVASVNGQSGIVVLNAADVGALPVAGTAEDSLRLGSVPAADFYHAGNKPTKSDVNLDNVPNDNPIVSIAATASISINRTAKLTYVTYSLAADVAFTFVAAGFNLGDKVYVTRAFEAAGEITMIADTGSITLAKKSTSAASQTLSKVGTICFEKISTGWLARAGA
jgi:hypothetical protein